jgi:hypothetical protein
MTESNTTVLGGAATPISLRIRGGPRDGQLIQLASRKCTIGAAENCTLRLRAQSVRPVHCLILRGPSETLIRRWSPDTLLNDRAFNDAILTPGDRLRCGPIELECVDQPAEDVDMRAVTQVIARPATADVRAEFDDRRWLGEQRRDLEAEKQQWRQQRKREEESLQQQREQVELLLAKQLARVKAGGPAP